MLHALSHSRYLTQAVDPDPPDHVDEIEKHSPDLNVLDYRIWSDINRRMRFQEKSWSAKKKEMRQVYKQRLRRTALRTSTRFVQSAVMDMARRCQLLVKHKGWHFEE